MSLDNEHPVIQDIGKLFGLDGFKRVPASEVQQGTLVSIDGVGVVPGDQLKWYRTDDGTEMAVAENGKYVVTAVGSQVEKFVLDYGQKNVGISMSAVLPDGVSPLHLRKALQPVNQPNRTQRRQLRFGRQR